MKAGELTKTEKERKARELGDGESENWTERVRVAGWPELHSLKRFFYIFILIFCLLAVEITDRADRKIHRVKRARE